MKSVCVKSCQQKTKKSKTVEPALIEIKRLFVDAVNKYADSRNSIGMMNR